MKLVLTIAAVAASLISSAANAAVEYVTYTASGSGSRYATNSVVGQIGPTERFDFIFSFGLPAGENTYTPLFPYQTYRFDGTTSGLISFSEYVIFGSASSTLTGSITYNDTDTLGGFPIALANNSATGGFTYRSGDPFSNRYTFMSGSITSFRVTGTGTPFTPVSLITYAVPETSTWGMMIAGFGMVGAAMRKRRHSLKISLA
jgi:hypothetical protein